MVAAAFLAGCESLPDEPRARARSASPPTAADRREPAVPERERVLFDYRQGVSALRAGRFDEAKTKLIEKPIHIIASEESVEVEVAMTYNTSYSENVISFVNNTVFYGSIVEQKNFNGLC